MSESITQVKSKKNPKKLNNWLCSKSVNNYVATGAHLIYER